MAPECSTPSSVQFIDRVVTFFQPAAKSILTQRTSALPSQFVGNVPENNTGMISKGFRQLFIDKRCFFTVYRGCVAMIMPETKHLAMPGLIYPKHLGILICQPLWSCPRRCAHNRINTIFIQTINDIFQPLEPEVSLLRLQCSPRKNAKSYCIATGFSKHTDILLKNIRSVQPLFRIVVSSIKQSVIQHIVFKSFLCLG